MSEAAEQRRERLVEVYNVASVCEKCPLSKTRTRVVFGSDGRVQERTGKDLRDIDLLVGLVRELA